MVKKMFLYGTSTGMCFIDISGRALFLCIVQLAIRIIFEIFTVQVHLPVPVLLARYYKKYSYFIHYY